MAAVKPEIKVDEPDRTLADIDEFEEDTDLYIPDENAASWLVNIPRDVWQVWKDMYDQAPEGQRIQLGTMRVYHEKPGEENQPLKQKIQIRLRNDIPQHENVLKNYDVKLTSCGDSNVSVFSEKDLPGHRSMGAGRNRLQASKPTGIPTKNERYGKDGRANYRTAIPKQTALAPQVRNEGKATPIEDAQYHEHIKKQWDAHVAPKSRVGFTAGIDKRLHPGLSSNLSSFNSFSLSSQPSKSKSKGGKVVRDKAVRMEWGELTHRLEDCFKEYKYWSMQNLRNRLHQPEAYIKEVLEPIAILSRSGDTNNHWMLKPEYASMLADAKIDEETKAGSGEDFTATGDEMEEGEEEFEDVKMEGS
ncbi:hypothetical protein EJ03DRAFT_327317 [Teratosphaeria nubilosa]|uniref:Transcription initiation factor IIF subunit beta n=1 Tax=Teratosphaeria nubilosa TaxID=161662 RepID=A0A6G1L9E0_9PEZI|nr:hypothetical protein EJ03DRAFT_327317 [Teratosphaeria nubilosa]